MDSHMKIDFLYIYIYLYPDCTKYMHRCYTVTVTVTGAIRATLTGGRFGNVLNFLWMLDCFMELQFQWFLCSEITLFTLKAFSSSNRVFNR